MHTDSTIIDIELVVTHFYSCVGFLHCFYLVCVCVYIPVYIVYRGSLWRLDYTL